ncbi:hypothetical protein [Microbulbifer sp. VAAF005]|uniref:hypothetical protein n=1 Tax=Microbulbifer sp. VAAF005 TaxID=3034230 RepID=UPI0024AD81BC|nr:hypothetical protein [Microbulbifer sp. VAAF005]WHI45021.1 hypothetical protein P0078_14910 [Microbulbifer sp. VAAF005]
MKEKKRRIGWALLFIWPILVLISIAATVGFLESNATEQKQTAATNSVEYQTLKQQLNSYNQRINNTNEIVAGYKAGNFKKVALEKDQRIDDLEEKRAQILAQLKAVQGDSTGSAQAAFQGWATLTHVESDKLQHGAFLALAVITDVVGLLALLAFNSAVTVKSTVTAEQDNAEQQEPLTEDQQQEQNHQEEPESGIELDESFSAVQRDLAIRIAGGEYGLNPVLRDINRSVTGGNAVVRPVFQHLQKIGVIDKQGRGFALIKYVDVAPT